MFQEQSWQADQQFGAIKELKSNNVSKSHPKPKRSFWTLHPYTTRQHVLLRVKPASILSLRL